MPRKALKIVVELTVHAVTCPGVWLPFRDDVYLSCCILGQHRRTKLVEPIFPFLYHEKLRFEKIYYTAIDPSQIADLIEDEHVLFELIQVSDTRSGGILLASYENDCRDFLYPGPNLLPIYGMQDREILMERTIDFPGISPRIEFATKTTIKETKMPHLDDSGEVSGQSFRRSRSRTRSPVPDYEQGYEVPTIASMTRSRSPSPAMRQRLRDLSMSESSDSKQPFVIRKKQDSLIGRIPGSPPLKEQKFRKKKKRHTKNDYSLRSRSVSPSRFRTTEYCPHCVYPHTDKNCTVCKLYKQYTGKRYAGHSYHFHPTPHAHKTVKVVRESGPRPRPVFESTNLDSYGDTEGTDEDLGYKSYSRPYSAPLYRAPSPILYKSSLRDRFDDPPYLPRMSDRIIKRVDEAIRRSRSPSPVGLRSLSPPRYRVSGYDSLDELEDTFRLARERSMVHVDDGGYWTEQASKYIGKSHRHLFYDNLGKLYSKMYKRARTQELDDIEDKLHYWELQ